jgi:hypothetical protein
MMATLSQSLAVPKPACQEYLPLEMCKTRSGARPLQLLAQVCVSKGPPEPAHHKCLNCFVASYLAFTMAYIASNVLSHSVCMCARAVFRTIWHPLEVVFLYGGCVQTRKLMTALKGVGRTG